MKNVSRTQFKEIFEAAIDLPASERAGYLDYQCADNREIRGEIEKLLAADEAAGSFLESSPLDESARNFDELRVRNYIGRQIGAYRIEREIGAGGMGTVFLAVRDLGGFGQQVALKIVHQGAHSKEIIRRFLIERKILAELEHSGIARLIDAGQTADNLPFLVMEYVDGEPLDEYCRRQNCAIAERLALFRQICAAVAYAHRRLIVHRDLKPSNILVTADGEVKLLDFGIAKLLSPTESGAEQTATLMNLLTPAYAAPEQIRGATVTTATDVYSLGVILYELLTGVRPFSFDGQNYQEIVRVICETEPTAPSVAWRDAETQRRGNTAKNRHAPTEIAASPARRVSASQLKGDLDNIILKALRKDPERRYQAVEQFSDDLERYQKGLPVTARPDTFSYRTAKFFERNKIAASSFAVIILLLVGGILTTTWQAVRAARQQKIAEQRFAQVRELANNFIFKYHDSIANLQGSTEVRQMLVADATKYLDNLAQDAETDENLQNELALAYSKLADVQGKPFYANTGDTAGALENYEKSIKLLENLTESKNAAARSRAEEELITTYHSDSALNSRIFDFDEAISVQRKALDLARRHLASDSSDLKRRLTFARASLWLGDAYSEAGNFTEAVELYRQFIGSAEEIYQTAPHDKDAQTVLAVAHDRIGRGFLLRGEELGRTDFPPEKIAGIYRESSVHLEKALELFKKTADENPDNQKYRRNFLDGQTNFAQVLRDLGETDRALPMLEEIVDAREKSIQADGGNRQLKADYAEDLHQLALTLKTKNSFDRAAAEFGKSLAVLNDLIAEDTENMEFRLTRLKTANDYGKLLFDRRDIGGALKNLSNGARTSGGRQKLRRFPSFRRRLNRRKHRRLLRANCRKISESRRTSQKPRKRRDLLSKSRRIVAQSRSQTQLFEPHTRIIRLPCSKTFALEFLISVSWQQERLTTETA